MIRKKQKIIIPIIIRLYQASRVSRAGLESHAPGTDIVAISYYISKRLVLWGNRKMERGKLRRVDA